MEELEINPEGEAPQQPEAASPDQHEGVSPIQTEAVSSDQTEGAATQEPESATAQAGETPPTAPQPVAAISMEELLAADDEAPAAAPMEDAQLMAVLEAVVYVA
jgi:hypothetical protein